MFFCPYICYVYIYIYISQYFYLQKQKDFISNTKKHTVTINKNQIQSLSSSFTLLNNCPNEFGHITIFGHIAILDTTGKNLREALGLNQWRNADPVIDWLRINLRIKVDQNHKKLKCHFKLYPGRMS